MAEVRALVVDDEDDMRFLTRSTIELENRELVGVGDAASGREAVERVTEVDATVVVVDQRMPGLSGVDTARLLFDAKPGVRVNLYSSYLDDSVIEAGRDAGIGHFVVKGDAGSLFAAVRE